MTYEEIVNTIDNKRRFGKACGRDVTSHFMDALNHPEMGFHIIHIAGTNGKGSVAAFVSNILQAASFASNEPFKVGLFTSPHLIDYTERIQINGQQISREDVTRIGTMLLGVDLDLEPTMFDYWLAMAMVYFRENNVDYVVLETGLGGAKDSTNGLSQYPEVCAITSIGLEHTQYLGDTIEAIAGEKAGIIKPKVPVVIGQLPLGAGSVIRDRAHSLGAEVFQAQPIDTNIELGLFGGYQRQNAATAVEIIKNLPIEITMESIKKGLAEASWPGRMQIISKNPFILLDGAHNPSGVQALYDSLRAEFPNEKFSFIMAVMADKDYLEMVEIIRPIIAEIYTVTIEYSRAMQSQKLAQSLQSIGIDAISCGDYKKAVKLASCSGHKVIMMGSLYFIGEVLHDKNEAGSM